MDYEQVYYVTDDGRNARSPVVVERTRAPARHTSVITTAAPTPPTGMLAPSAIQYQYPQSYYGPAVMPQSWFGYPTRPVYAVPPVPPSTNLASLLGGFGDLGSLTNMIAQVAAALLPLPVAPEPFETSKVPGVDPAIDAAANSINLIKYQSALAQFARRDQQILTLGSVLKELFKRPGATVMG